MTLFYKTDQQVITLVGQTYQFRQSIKDLGGFFLGPQKLWQIPYTVEKLEKVDRLCKSAGGGILFVADETRNLEEKSNSSFLIDENIQKLFSLPLVAKQVNCTDLKEEIFLEETSPAVSSQATLLNSSKEAPVFSISQLLFDIEKTIHESYEKPVWLVGEIENLAHKPNGLFFSLAEKSGTSDGASFSIGAMVWSSNLRNFSNAHGSKLDGFWQNGIKIKVLCFVKFYKNRSSVTLQVTDIDPSYTQGDLALARELIMKKLRSENLDQLNKKLSLVPLPFRVGLISAEDSRAKSDFIHQLLSLGFVGELLFAPALMQGEQTQNSVIDQLQKLQDQACDVIVITRGGGGLADLRWFDNYQIAKAVSLSPIPVVCAIGHHEDFCVIEEICYLRCKTPTAAADFIFDCFLQVKERIQNGLSKLQQVLFFCSQKSEKEFLRTKEVFQNEIQRKFNTLEQVQNAQQNQLSSLLQKHLFSYESKVNTFIQKLFYELGQLFQKETFKIKTLEQQLAQKSGESFLAFEKNILSYNTLLDRHNPKPWLEKGWTQLFSMNNTLIDSTDKISAGDLVKVRLKDGKLILIVQKNV